MRREPTVIQCCFLQSHTTISTFHTQSLLNGFQTSQGPWHTDLHRWSPDNSPICESGQHSRRMSIKKIWRLIAVTPWCWRWCSQLAVNLSDYGKLIHHDDGIVLFGVLYLYCRVCTDPGKCLDLEVKISRPGKSWEKALILENPGKLDVLVLVFVMEQWFI